MGLRYRMEEADRRRMVYEFGDGWVARTEWQVGLSYWLFRRGFPAWAVNLPSAVLKGRWGDYFAGIGHGISYRAWKAYRPVRVALWRQFRLRLPHWKG